MSRDGKYVTRPDSGDPVYILCGDPGALPGSPESKGVVELLWDIFGGTKNAAGFKVLDPHVGTIYGDSITIARAEDITRLLEAKGFASQNVVFGIGSYCVSPNTPILCSDLIWRKAGSLEPGQEIIAFDEDPTFGDGRHAARRYKLATITVNRPSEKPCKRIVTDIGDPIVASDDHPWLVWVKNRNTKNVMFDSIVSSRDIPRSAGLAWRRTSELEPGDQLAYFAKPWTFENTREGGWLCGMFDGEGSLSRSTGDERIPAWKVNVSQNKGPTLDRLREELTKRGFGLYENPRECSQLVVTGGWVETLHFLGTIRPERLLQKLPEVVSDMPALKCDYTYQLATVTAVEDVGVSEVASITTSCGTFITGGYLSHNTYQYVTRDVYGFAMKATWVEINGQGRDIYKTPKTDNGMKKSARGRLSVLRDASGALQLIEQATKDVASCSLLRPVWRDGRFLAREDYPTIRARARKNLVEDVTW